MNELLIPCLTTLCVLGTLLAFAPGNCDAATTIQDGAKRQTPDPYFTQPKTKPAYPKGQNASWNAPLTPIETTSSPGPFRPSKTVRSASLEMAAESSQSIIREPLVPLVSAPKEKFIQSSPPQRTTPQPSQPTFASFEPGQVVALVGGEPIFIGDMLFEINQLIEKFMADAPEDIKDRERKKMIPQILPKFIEAKILFLGAIRSLPEGADLEQVFEQAGKEFDDKALPEMLERSGMESIEYDAHLRAQGSSLRQLRRSWSQEQLTRYFVGQQVSASRDITHQELLDKYQDNIATYAMPAKCRWEQMMIRFDRTSSHREAKNTLSEMGNRVIGGANFSAVAKKDSHGFRADTGGEHDWTTKNALVSKAIDKAIFTLPIGELSEIIESEYGVHIIRVLERTEAKNKPFLEAQVEIKKNIENERRQKAFADHVAKLKAEIPVEYLLNDDITLPSQDSND